MKLTAIHSITHNKATFAPGSTLDVNPAADADRLIKLGAAEPWAEPASVPVPASEPQLTPEEIAAAEAAAVKAAEEAAAATKAAEEAAANKAKK